MKVMKILIQLLAIFFFYGCSTSDNFEKSYYLIESSGTKIKYTEIYVLSNGDILVFFEPMGLLGIRANIQYSDGGDSAKVKNYHEDKIDTLVKIENTENYLMVSTLDTLIRMNEIISNKLSIENPRKFENQAFERMKKNCRKCRI